VRDAIVHVEPAEHDDAHDEAHFRED